MTISKHYCYLENDPNATDPPEYFIPGATSVPIIRGEYTEVREDQPLDDRRRAIKSLSLNGSVDLFASLLFSNEVFSIDLFDSEKIVSLVDQSIAKFNYNDLYVQLRFGLEDDGTYSLRSKRFLTPAHEHFCFENKISSVISVKPKEKLNQSNNFTQFKTLFKNRFQLTDYAMKKQYTETVYLAESRVYLDITVNCESNNSILPLIVAYDEFGIIYADFFYRNKLIDKSILTSVKPDFNDKVVDFGYFTKDETEAVKMFLI